MQEVLFEDYRISSQNDDRIAFTVDLSLLLRALKSSVSMDGEKLQVKLVKKRTLGSERPIPFLTLESMVLFNPCHSSGIVFLNRLYTSYRESTSKMLDFRSLLHT